MHKLEERLKGNLRVQHAERSLFFLRRNFHFSDVKGMPSADGMREGECRVVVAADQVGLVCGEKNLITLLFSFSFLINFSIRMNSAAIHTSNLTMCTY